MSQSDQFASASGPSRNLAVAGAVVVAHAAALWAMQHGLAQQHPPEVVVPAAVIAEFIAPPAPEPKPPAPPPPPPPPAPAPKPQPKPQIKPELKKAPLPKAIKDPTPAPAAPQGSTEDSQSKPDKVSKRMGEQGKVMLRVYINEQGQPEKIEIKQSSGFDRLDDAAINTVRQWKFVPGKRNGVPEAMWHIVPINFVLK